MQLTKTLHHPLVLLVLHLLVLAPGQQAASLRRLSQTLLGTDSISNSNVRHLRRHKERSRVYDWTAYYETIPLQPSSSFMIPLDIEESVNSDLDPDLDTLDEIKLLKILGDDYNRHYMSITQPMEMALYPDGILHYSLGSKNKPSSDDMPVEIQQFSGKEVDVSSDGPKLRVKFSRKKKNKLQKFLWAYSFCPVRYKWKQLSTRFWPRWIRTGTCDSRKSCSIPTGMTCQPTSMKDIKILRYYCPIQGQKNSCQWIKFEYPVLDKCTCACQNNSSPVSYYS